MLVSTAITASYHFPANGTAHLRRSFRSAPGPQTAGHLFEIGAGEMGGRPEQNSIPGFLDGEFRARSEERRVGKEC
jgi:hypothetical protein